MAGGGDAGLSLDGFLGGRVRVWQPKRGYRAATDPVFLAASIPARPGQSVLDLGCGVGTAALCLGRRIGGLELHGLEIQPDYAALARRNGEENGIPLVVHEGSVAAMPAALRQLTFDHVMMNPPYLRAGAATAPADAGKGRANLGAAEALGEWIAAGLRRLRQGGCLTVIHRPEALGEILAAAGDSAGDTRVLPIAPRTCRNAGRVLVQTRKGRRAPLRILWPFVVHDGDAHDRDADNFTEKARDILRNMVNLSL
ncbi:MAG: tRNA1(Val) (adenine(37)-N6)-methyltransferase [Paracoccaceae bacterium]